MRRLLIGEVMDQPGLDQAAHEHALRSLNRANRWFGMDRRLWRQVRKLAGEDCSVLDIGCGGGGFLHSIFQAAVATANNSRLLIGVDRSEQALRFARAGCVQLPPIAASNDQVHRDPADSAPRNGRRTLQSNVERFSLGWEQHHGINWLVGDALQLPLADGSVDAAVCSLFLHHFHEAEIVTILREAARVARRGVIVGELVRSWPAWIGTYAATRLLSRSWIFHADGPRSVRAAFRGGELRELAASAGLDEARVRRVFPFRYIMTWQQSPTHGAKRCERTPCATAVSTA